MTPAAPSFDWVQYLLSFALVIGLLLALLWGLKKLQLGATLVRRSGARVQVIETVALGTRQKIALVRVDDREVLIGVTAQTICALGDAVATRSTDSGDINTPATPAGFRAAFEALGGKAGAS
jgi:flagellar protein FliO/FliZ